jgi:tetratricopeptide (TPR) repeat protein
MSLSIVLLIIGIAYILIWGLMSLLRREGLSMRFALESLAITLVFSLLAALTGFQLHPIVFLLLLYLFTMRARLLVDVANMFAQRRQIQRADSLYNLAKRLWPDPSSKLIILLNQGVSFLQRGEVDQAIAALKGLLQEAEGGYLGVKYEAAAHYNLGQAYRRKDMGAEAVRELNECIDVWPGSLYARRAQEAIELWHKKP